MHMILFWLFLLPLPILSLYPIPSTVLYFTQMGALKSDLDACIPIHPTAAEGGVVYSYSY